MSNSNDLVMCSDRKTFGFRKVLVEVMSYRFICIAAKRTIYSDKSTSSQKFHGYIDEMCVSPPRIAASC